MSLDVTDQDSGASSGRRKKIAGVIAVLAVIAVVSIVVVRVASTHPSTSSDNSMQTWAQDGYQLQVPKSWHEQMINPGGDTTEYHLTSPAGDESVAIYFSRCTNCFITIDSAGTRKSLLKEQIPDDAIDVKSVNPYKYTYTLPHSFDYALPSGGTSGEASPFAQFNGYHYEGIYISNVDLTNYLSVQITTEPTHEALAATIMNSAQQGNSP